MTSLALLHDLQQYPYVWPILCGTLCIGLLSGMWSPLIVAKERSYVAEALAHLVLPGTTIGYTVAQYMQLPVTLTLLFFTTAAAFLGLWCWQLLSSYLKLPQDAAGMATLSGFFALGLIALSKQSQGTGGSLGFESLFMGDVLSLGWWECGMLFTLVILSFGCLWILKNDWTSWIADPEFGTLCGYRIKLLNILFPFILTTVCLAGLFAVGGLMIAALLVLPAILFDRRHIFSWRCILGSVLLNLLGLGFAFQFNIPLGPTVAAAGFGCALAKVAWVKVK